MKRIAKIILTIALIFTSLSSIYATNSSSSTRAADEQITVDWCGVGQFATAYAVNQGYVSAPTSNDPNIRSAKKAYIEDGCYDSYNEAVARAESMDGDEKEVPIVIALSSNGERIAYAKYGVVYLNNSSSSATFGIYTEPNSVLRKTYVNATSQQDALLVDMANIGWAKITMAGVTGYLKLTNASGTFIHEIIPLPFLDITTTEYDDASFEGYRITRYGASATDSTAMFLEVLQGTRNSYLSHSGLADKPRFMDEEEVYYSYDGHYFYDNLVDMIDDAREESYDYALNDEPYYNYYQYLPARGKTNMSATDFNTFLITNKPTAGDQVTYCYTSSGNTTGCSSSHAYKYSGPSSILYNNAEAFLQGQDNYGVNAAMIYVKAALEGAYGMSTIARAKYNPFGVNAVDSAPFSSATKYSSVYEGVESQFKKVISLGYANPYDSGGRYNGSHTGDKNSGMNTLYASDPNWGFKLASLYRSLDIMSGFKDINYYQLAVTTTPKAVIYEDSSAKKEKVVLQHYNTINNYVFDNVDIPLIIVDSISKNGKKMYKVVVDTPSDQSNGYYYYDSADYGYIYASDVYLINEARDGYQDPKDVGDSNVSTTVSIETFETPIVVSNSTSTKLYDSYRTDIVSGYTSISKGLEFVAVRAATTNNTKYYEVIVDYTKSPYRTQWMLAKDAKVEEDVSLVITQASSLNCRESASTKSESLGLVKTERSPMIYVGKTTGDTVNGESTWYKVLFDPMNEEVGYISGAYATLQSSGEDTSGDVGNEGNGGTSSVPVSPSEKTDNIVYNLFFNEQLYVFGTGVVEGVNTPSITSALYEVVFTAKDGTKYTYPLAAATNSESLSNSDIFNPNGTYDYTYSWYEGSINFMAVGKNGIELVSLPSGTYTMEVSVNANGTVSTFPMVNGKGIPLASKVNVGDSMTYTLTMNEYGEMSIVIENSASGELDLSDYTNDKLDVYPNSRVTSMSYSNGVLNLEGYAFIKDRSVSTSDYKWLWREVIFVNEDNSSRDYAYRASVTPINKGSFLTSNKTLNPTGKYSYAMATYKVSANIKSINNYDQKPSSIAPGKYRVYVRCSDGVNGKLFPLKDLTLSDGTNLENTGKLPSGFEVIDQTSRELRLVVQ
ncbi:MAG: glucosaminidase domain-containing protein [Erysipelotrichales bacterium]|nr:glucosaminidase domain-containing protein [Erysipelotrichales bacterium]